jgi:RimJ/RimL family protein N-acetyltransferase
MEIEHAAALFEAGSDPAVWTYLPRPVFADVADARGWIDEALAGRDAGDQLPFVLVDPTSGRVVGSTRFLEIRREHRGLEIGWTWIAPNVQRTGANTAAKRVLLRHAFVDLGALRVQFKTDRRNERSQRAIERIGGVREGVLRNHYVLSGGYVRDSVYYSITAEEWPGVDARLGRLLTRA